jgi:hypothetical protein
MDNRMLRFGSRLFVTVTALAVSTAAHAATPTWTTLASSANPSATGAAVTFTATVKVVGGGGPPTGTVTFKDAATVLGAIPLSGSGTAAFTTAALTRGTHEIVAVYSGDTSFSASTSPAVSQAVPDKVGCSVANFFAAPSAPLNLGTQTPLPVFSADFNLDGKPDLAVGYVGPYPSTGGVKAYLGDGAAGFNLSADVPVSASSVSGMPTPRMAASDFNLDGKPDLVVAGGWQGSTGSASTVNLLLGDGSGGFTLSPSSPIAPGHAIAAGDVNLDGKPDLLVADAPAHTVAIFLGDGSGGFTPAAGSPITMRPTQKGPSEPLVLRMGDFNGDGRPDVVVGISTLLTGSAYTPGTSYSDAVTILIGDGGGRFTDSLSPTQALATFPRDLEVADLNGDGKQDIVVTQFSFSSGVGSVTTLLGNGDGTFVASKAIDGSVGNYPALIVLRDFNGDGRVDLALTDQDAQSNNVSMLPGLGDGKFSTTAGVFMTIQRANFGITTADFNLDGTPDLSIAITGNSRLTTLVNNCGAPATATTVTTSPNPSSSGQAVTLTATVAPVSGSGNPTGTVQFRDGAGTLGSPVTLVGGSASLVTSALGGGVRSITAVYGGSADFASSTSPPVSHTVQSRLTVNDVTANSATPTTLGFQVSLSAASNLPVTVSYATSDRTAKAGTDYTAASGTLTFDPGQTTRTVSISILQGAPGASKDFFLTLSNPTNAILSRGTGIGTIVYTSSGALTIQIDDPSVKEGNTGTILLGFSVSLSRATAASVTVQYATADGTGAAGTDYVAKSGTLTFAPGKTNRTVLVPVTSDIALNGNRTLFVNLTSATGGAQVVKSQGTGTIVDDDPASTASTVSQLRLYSNATFEHLYTTDTNEYAVLATRGWNQEGTAYTMFQDAGLRGTAYGIPIYRLYHAGIQQHHWTTDWHETTVLAAGAWDYEGIPGYVLPTPETGTIPLYRLSLASPPLHLWTTDANEKLVLSTQRGWVYEGILGYVIP